MSNEEEMHRQVPSFPVLFQISTIPPIFIETTIAKSDDFRHDVEEQMKNYVKSQNPSDRIGNRQS